MNELEHIVGQVEELITKSLETGVRINKIFAIVSAIVILISTLVAVYLATTVISFKH